MSSKTLVTAKASQRAGGQVLAASDTTAEIVRSIMEGRSRPAKVAIDQFTDECPLRSTRCASTVSELFDMPAIQLQGYVLHIHMVIPV